MSVLSRVKRAVGVGASDPSEHTEEREQSHVCRSCGEAYYTDPSANIPKCRTCGGVKIEAV